MSTKICTPKIIIVNNFFVHNMWDILYQNIQLTLERHWQNLANQMPQILSGIGVLLLGIIVSETLARIITWLLQRVKLDVLMRKVGFESFLKQFGSHLTLIDILAKSLKGYLLFVFALAAAKIWGLTEVGLFGDKVLAYIPHVIVAIFIIVVGFRMSRSWGSYLLHALQLTKSQYSELIAKFGQYSIIIFAIMAALAELKIATGLIYVLFVGLVGTFSLIFGLAFGLGGQAVAQEILLEIRNQQMNGTASPESKSKRVKKTTSS